MSIPHPDFACPFREADGSYMKQLPWFPQVLESCMCFESKWNEVDQSLLSLGFRIMYFFCDCSGIKWISYSVILGFRIVYLFFVIEVELSGSVTLFRFQNLVSSFVIQVELSGSVTLFRFQNRAYVLRSRWNNEVDQSLCFLYVLKSCILFCVSSEIKGTSHCFLQVLDLCICFESTFN